MAKTLVIVESPTKARSLERFLGDGSCDLRLDLVQ